MMGDYGWGAMGWMPFMGIFWLLILVLIIAAVIGVLRTPGDVPDRSAGSTRSAGLAILDERYARGEINRDEYLEKKQDIVGRDRPSLEPGPNPDDK